MRPSDVTLSLDFAPSREIDERGHVQWTAYDPAGRRASTTDATGAVTRCAYDAAGNQVSMTDALGHTTQSAYDAANRVVATTYADGNADATLYDPPAAWWPRPTRSVGRQTTPTTGWAS